MTSHTSSNQTTEPIEIRRHKFKKVNFTKPMWCIFANKFIWGLEKSGYQCSVCEMVCSRPQIAFAKKTVCSSSFKNDTMVSANLGAKAPKNAFTIYLPMGAKKSMIVDPSQPLKECLLKVCRERGINLEEYYAQDKNGMVVAMSTLLSDIPDHEITFTRKDGKREELSRIPPLIDDLLKEESEKASSTTSSSKSAKSKKSSGDKTLLTPRGENAKSKSKGSTNEKELATTEQMKILDCYSLDEELGNGAFSVVYSARHKKTGQVVAIKVLEKYQDEVAQQTKLKREISIHKNLAHDNIIKFIQLSEDEEHYYVVMELVLGGELFEQICDQKYLYEKEASPLICQVIQGLIYLHDRGIAHRDIKPENLLFADKSYKTIKIADFGESKTFYDGQLQTYCGTPDYMSPEIIKSEVYGREVDMWALGVTTFVLLGGYAPFEGENDTEVFAAILTLDYKYISPEWDHVGPLGKEFIDALLKINPAERLTARQALSHPFIVKYTSPELRKTPNLDLGDRNFLDNPKHTVLDTIEKFLGIIKGRIVAENRPTDKIVQGELLYMKQLLSNANPTATTFEKNAFGATWVRLQELHAIVYG